MPTSTLAQANKANLAAKADHEIRVELDQQKVYVVAHFPGPMNLGETVHCSSKDGDVEIYFNVNGSPFLNLDRSLKTEIDSNDPPLELKLPGNFIGRCYITTPNGVVHPYNPLAPHIPGGDMIVR